MATSTLTETAIQICDLTAFSEVPKKALIRRCCLIHLKKSSTCQRQRYSSVIVSAGKAKLLVRKMRVLAVSGSLKRMRVAALDLEVRLATGHEEAAGLVEAIEALEVEEATIHDVESAGFRQQSVKDVDLVHLAITDVNEGGNVAAQIEQRMQLDGCLGRAEHGPRKYRQTQIDGGGVERV